ncbi:LamG-like jellyroll fold domain-containing protein [Aquimarina brevivitae]|uniref:Concanavalin A-like lectin/glucanase superfamily protein n=1 Tax=Aquimarina brevivitae TaxID=323412 RepID=A0A4Q7NY50_9FLAO|nr:LamG-like jellyroll fold domain-containing protein [Aquimarina brevivitae]RZS91940.1 concanavalin A-like lectin/glucanase superfamily protein [Aquimarina brevivitae]
MNFKYTKTGLIVLLTTLVFLSCSNDDESVPTPALTPLDNENLLAYYTFEGSLADVSTSQVDGNATTPTYVTDRNGNPLEAYSITGQAEQRFTTEDFPLGAGSFSTSFWLFIDGDAVADDVVGKARYIFGTREICNLSNFFNFQYVDKTTIDPTLNTFILEIRQADGGNANISTTGIEKDTWIHVVSIANNEAKTTQLYFDGVLKEEVDWQSVSMDLDISNTAPLEIGGNVCVGNNGADVLTSFIDDLAIFSAVLTSQEISDFASDSLLAD